MVVDDWSPLSREGKAFLLVAANPLITVGEMAERLKVSEKSISRSMTILVGANWVRRTKVGGVHTYQIVKGCAQNHPDIQSLLEIVGTQATTHSQTRGDSTHEQPLHQPT